MKERKNLVKRLTESAVMISLATVLSLFKLVDMPYGGSVTPASMLPIIVIAYRHGVPTGLGSGIVFALIQQLLGLNNLSYVTGWQSVVAVILLDYALAFTVLGFGGIFKKRLALGKFQDSTRQSLELGIGAIFVSVLRYVLHTVAGATVWAGLSIPSEAALVYSLGYNATYMIPETIVTAAAAFMLGSVIDFEKPIPKRFLSDLRKGERALAVSVISARLAVLFAVATAVTDVILIAPLWQNEEDGAFDLSNLASQDLTALIVVSIVGALLTVAAITVAVILRKRVSAGRS